MAIWSFQERDINRSLVGRSVLNITLIPYIGSNVESHSGAGETFSQGPSGENFIFLFKMAHSGVLYRGLYIIFLSDGGARKGRGVWG